MSTTMRHRLHLLLLAGAMLLAVPACRSSASESAKTASRGEVVFAENGEPAGLQHHHRWSDRIGQGAQPEGEIAFRNLAALGYTTVITVDGSSPDVETAAKFGLRYVHVPIGYDGVPADAAARIVAAVQRSDGPVYVHCHHGKHRGPAGAAIARMALDGVSNAEATKGLQKSGTSPKYEGLWRDIAAFHGCSEDEMAKVPAQLPSRVKPQGMRAAMVAVSQRWEFLGASRANEWGAVPHNPDVSPPHEARMLWEAYREIQRLDEAKSHGDAFLALAKQGEQAATALETALRAGDHAAADKLYGQLRKNCNACHGDYRN